MNQPMIGSLILTMIVLFVSSWVYADIL